MRALTIMCAVVATLSPAASWAEGAIAASRNGRVGISYNYGSQREANDRAMDECGGTCRIVERFSNLCGAVASGRDGGYGFATRSRLGAAENAAIANCQSEGNRGCSIRARGCDDR